MDDELWDQETLNALFAKIDRILERLAESGRRQDEIVETLARIESGIAGLISSLPLPWQDPRG
jgi:hypothetical protein